MENPTINTALEPPFSIQNDLVQNYDDGMASIQSCDLIHLRIEQATGKTSLLRRLTQVRLFSMILECAFGTYQWNNKYLKLPSKQFDKELDTSQMPFHFRLSYWTWSTVLASLITFLFGTSMAVFVPELTWFQSGAAMLLIAGTGWLVQASIAYLGIGNKRNEYLSNLVTIMWLGTIPLLPAALLDFFLPNPNFLIPLVAVAFSSLMMLRQHFVRTQSLQLSQIWTLSWFLVLQSTALIWIALLTDYL